MAHWHTVLPGFVHDVSYEALVADFDTEALALIAGLRPRLARGVPAVLQHRPFGADGKLRPGAPADLQELGRAGRLATATGIKPLLTALGR